jgi:hypothetical protein
MIYEEKITFWVGKCLVVIFPLTALYMFWLAYQQLTKGPIGKDPAPTWFYIAFGTLFLLLTWLMIQFTTLSIRVEEKNILLNYGVFKIVIDREEIEKVYQDTANPLLAYGGWGYRLGYYKGRPRKALNIPGYKCVVISRKGIGQEIVFSTAFPEEVIKLLSQPDQT